MTSRTRLSCARALLAVMALAAAPVAAQDWFLHDFGERRAFFKDWLAVCSDAGAGPCRLVRSSRDATNSAFDTRVSLHRSPEGWHIEVMDRGLPAHSLSELRFVFDDTQRVVVTRDGFDAGAWTVPSVSDTVTINDPETVDKLLDAMRGGIELRISYAPIGSGDGAAVVPLRGVTAGLAELDQIQNERTQ